MPRKFISFLGAIPYHKTQYYKAPDRSDLSEPIYYVQESILRSEKIDEVLIFTTDEALTNNYFSRVYTVDKKNYLAEGEGLQSILETLNDEGVINNFHPVDIPNGYTEKEILSIFQKVFSRLEPNDEVIFDITFGFRSLPMLVMVLLDYARTLKGVSLKAIYYGNYEAGRAEREKNLDKIQDEAVKAELKSKPIEAPILDLRAFSVLQNWTYAAQSFTDGNMGPLVQLTADSYPKFSEELDFFARSIQTCRGQALSYDLDIDQLKQLVVQIGEQSDLEAQISPLLEKVGKKLEAFNSHQLANGLAAVEWCIQHGMIQQGITFLQESLQSLVVEKIAGEAFICDRLYRFAANGALNGFSSAKKTIEEKNRMDAPLADDDVEILYEQMYQFVKRHSGLSRWYKQLTGEFRNDINHCGFRLPYNSPQDLARELSVICEAIKGMNLFSSITS